MVSAGQRDGEVDVLVVGAGPTGLALGLQLARFGVRLRIVDRLADRTNESRALAIQPRTLEVLEPLGVTEELVAAGNADVAVVLHARGRSVPVRLGGSALRDTRYPFLLFLSQATTERVLEARLSGWGVRVERSTHLVTVEPGVDAVTCGLRGPTGGAEVVRARFVVGADGAHSTVRALAGIPFPGTDYPRAFALADLEAEPLDVAAAHVFLSESGMLFFFPLLTPASWRMLAMTGPRAGSNDLTLAELQAVADRYGADVRLRDPVWMTRFQLHSRSATTYRRGRLFLSGDAAHIHSPAGAQGMNTGIQDAVNLGWKLALVLTGASPEPLLNTYDDERRPVARRVLRMADRAFRVATSTRWPVRTARTRLVPLLLPMALHIAPGRARAYRVVTELAVGYRSSPLSVHGPGRRSRGPQPGDRLPDAPLRGTTLHRALARPGFHALLCGRTDLWTDDAVGLLDTWHPRLHVHRLTRDEEPGALIDPAGHALRTLGLARPDQAGILLVRPDGHLAYRGGPDVTAALRWLTTWLPPHPARAGGALT